MQTITAYNITITRAYSIWEQGSGYSWEPWGRNTEYYEGDDVSVDVEVGDDYSLQESVMGELLLYPGGLRCHEAIALGVAQLAKPSRVA